jgi:hypothetical protein
MPPYGSSLAFFEFLLNLYNVSLKFVLALPYFPDKEMEAQRG